MSLVVACNVNTIPRTNIQKDTLKAQQQQQQTKVQVSNMQKHKLA